MVKETLSYTWRNEGSAKDDDDDVIHVYSPSAGPSGPMQGLRMILSMVQETI